jgi:hypothetical protein
MSVLIFIDHSSLTALNEALVRRLDFADFDASPASCQRLLLSDSDGYGTYTITHNADHVKNYVIIFHEFSKKYVVRSSARVVSPRRDYMKPLLVCVNSSGAVDSGVRGGNLKSAARRGRAHMQPRSGPDDRIAPGDSTAQSATATPYLTGSTPMRPNLDIEQPNGIGKAANQGTSYLQPGKDAFHCFC